MIGGRKALLLPVRLFLLSAFATAFLVALSGDALSYNPYFDDFTRTSCRPLSMGEAGAALADDPSAVYYNPAGLACLHKFSLMHNHSARHMPRYVAEGEVDQLDGDTQAVVFPVSPSITAAAGFNFQGEMGYDYLKVWGIGGIPRERFSGVERFECLAFALSPWTQVGAGRRSFYHKYERPPYDRGREERLRQAAKAGKVYSLDRMPTYPGDVFPYKDELTWSRIGDGYTLGVRQWAAPGLTYGYSTARADFDYGDNSSGRVIRTDSGWAWKPVAWLTLAWDNETTDYKWRGRDMKIAAVPESKKTARFLSGAEINLAGIARARFGSLAGSKTWGVEWTLPNLRLWYTEAKGFMDAVVGIPLGKMRDLHMYGFVLTLP